MTTSRIALALATSVAAASAAHAGEVYGNLGFPGVMLGYAMPVSERLTLRADIATLGDRSDRRSEAGISYDASLKTTRVALLADWFPMAGAFRFTGGVTSNQYKIDLLATGAGGSLTIGNTTYPTTAADRFDVQVKFPSTTPYLGIGWGHGVGSGLRFSFDLGAAIGKAKVSYQLSGPAAGLVSQADVDAELAQLRDGVGKVRAIPQLSFGIGYSF